MPYAVRNFKSHTSSQSEASRIPRSMSLSGTKSGRLVLALKYSLAAFWSKSSATFRSARGHWKIQSTTKRRMIDFGPALQSLPDGSFQPRIETQARIRGIDNLLATHPWVDIVDMQMFLNGFDAGAKWYRSNPDLDTGESKRAEA